MFEKFIYRVILFLQHIYKQHQINVLRKNEQIDIHLSFKCEGFLYFNVDQQIRKLVIEDGFFCKQNCKFLIMKDAELIIRKNVFFNNSCSVSCLGFIEIGSGTIFGEAVKIYDHNHKYSQDNDGTLRVERNQYNIGKVIIGRNCWIGSNVTILNNVVIGDNVIIGANCLIYKSIPSNTIVKSNNELSFS